MNKDELVNIIDECLCHYKNGAIAYTRNDLINKIIDAVDLYHNSEFKKNKFYIKRETVETSVELNEQLLSFAKFLDEDTITGLIGAPEYYVERFLSK